MNGETIIQKSSYVKSKVFQERMYIVCITSLLNKTQPGFLASCKMTGTLHSDKAVLKFL